MYVEMTYWVPLTAQTGTDTAKETRFNVAASDLSFEIMNAVYYYIHSCVRISIFHYVDGMRIIYYTDSKDRY